jgi:predicted NAD/FAD-dependent oxidoreductase
VDADVLVVGAGLAGLRCARVLGEPGHAVVVLDEAADALPAQAAPYSATRPVRVGELVVRGDHRDTGSIQGSLVSGQRAAEAVLAALR